MASQRLNLPGLDEITQVTVETTGTMKLIIYPRDGFVIVVNNLTGECDRIPYEDFKAIVQKVIHQCILEDN